MPSFIRKIKRELKSRDKRNLKTLKSAFKMTGNESLLLGHVDLLDEETYLKYQSLLISKLEEELQDFLEFEKMQRTGKAPEGEMNVEDVQRKRFAFYKRRMHHKRILEKLRDRLKVEERERLEELDLFTELELEELEDELKKPRKKSRQPLVKDMMISMLIQKRMEQLQKIALHAQRAPGDQAGMFDKRQVDMEHKKYGDKQTFTELKHDFSLGQFAKDVGMIGGIQRALAEKRGVSSEPQLGGLKPDIGQHTHDVLKGHGPEMGR